MQSRFLSLFSGLLLLLSGGPVLAYTGQCITASGDPNIGVNFGVKTLDEENNQAGVEKDNFYSWHEANDYYVQCDCDSQNVPSGRWAFAASSPLPSAGGNWFAINDYLAVEVSLQVKDSSSTTVPFENIGTAADNRKHICMDGGQRLGGTDASGHNGSFSLKILQPFVGTVTMPNIVLAYLYECYNIPASNTCSASGAPVLTYYLSGTVNSLESCSVNGGETVEVNLENIFAGNFTAIGQKPFGAKTAELSIPVRCNTGNSGMINVSLSLSAATDPDYPQAIKTSRSGVGVMVTDRNGVAVSPAGGSIPLSIPNNADGYAQMNVYPVSTTGMPPEPGGFEATASIRIDFD